MIKTSCLFTTSLTASLTKQEICQCQGQQKQFTAIKVNVIPSSQLQEMNARLWGWPDSLLTEGHYTIFDSMILKHICRWRNSSRAWGKSTPKVSSVTKALSGPVGGIRILALSSKLEKKLKGKPGINVIYFLVCIEREFTCKKHISCHQQDSNCLLIVIGI